MKIDHAVFSFMSTTTALNCNYASIISTTEAFLPKVKVFSGFMFDKSSKYETDLERVPGL
jgi:hypothetical protein